MSTQVLRYVVRIPVGLDSAYGAYSRLALVLPLDVLQQSLSVHVFICAKGTPESRSIHGLLDFLRFDLNFLKGFTEVLLLLGTFHR